MTKETGQTGIDLSGSTSAGAGIKFGFNKALLPFAFDQSQTVGSILVYPSGRVIQSTIIQGGTLVGDVPSPCKIDNPWLSASRTFTQSDDDTKVIEDITVKKSLIANTDLHGSEFRKMQETLKDCWKDTTLVFQANAATDPNHSFPYVEPWRWTEWKRKWITMRKFIRNVFNSVKDSADKKQPANDVIALDPMPEWTKGKTSEELKKKLGLVLEKAEEETTGLIAAKFVLLDLARLYPKDPQIYGMLARTEFKLGYVNDDEHDAKALERTKYYAYRALEIDPFHPLAHRMLAWYLLQGKDASYPVKQAAFAISLDRYSPHATALSEKIAFRQKDFGKALYFAIELDDYSGMIEVYRATKRYDEAEATYEKQVLFEPSPWNYLNFSSFLTQIGKKPDKAIELAKKSLELGETGAGHWALSNAYCLKADELVRAKKLSEAIDYYQMALAEKNDSAYAHSTLGSILSSLGKEQRSQELLVQARQHLEIAERLDPQNFKGKVILSNIKATLATLSEKPRSAAPLLCRLNRRRRFFVGLVTVLVSQ